MLKFNGEMRDNVSGGYHLGQGKRLYLPTIMRFTSPDDFSPFLRGGINSYGYCAGDPVNYTDPTGRSGVPTLFKLAKRVVKDNPELLPNPILPSHKESEFGVRPTPKVKNGKDEFNALLRKDMSSDEILKLHPHLKTHIKRESRIAAITGHTIHPHTPLILLLSKHRKAAVRFTEFSHKSGTRIPPGKTIYHASAEARVRSTLKYGLDNGLTLEPGEFNKFIRWANYLDVTTDDNPYRPIAEYPPKIL